LNKTLTNFEPIYIGLEKVGQRVTSSKCFENKKNKQLASKILSLAQGWAI